MNDDIATQPVSRETVVAYVCEVHGAHESDVVATLDRLLADPLWKSYWDFAESMSYNADVMGHDVAIHMGLVDPQWTVTEP